MVGTLELLGGNIEVIAWADLLERTRELWGEGTFLWVVGKVKEREGRLSVHCDEVKPYEVMKEELEAPEREPEVTHEPAPPSPSQQVLLISLAETGEATEDAHLLHEVLRTCLEYPGSDRVNLEIITGGQRVRLDVPIVATQYCPELHQRLEKLVGSGKLTLCDRADNGQTP